MTSEIIEQPKEIEVVKEEKWTNVQIDSQILNTYMACPKLMDFRFNRKLIPVSGLSRSISKGQLSHIGAHNYWKSIIEGKDYQESSRIGIEATKNQIKEFSNIEPDDALDVLKNLVDFFKFIQNSSWIPLFVEKHFKIVLFEDPIIKLRIIYTGRIDLGLKTPQIPLIPVDMKSESERWFYSTMSNQFKGYSIACGTNVFGVQRFGFQKTLEPKDKFKMEMLSFDPDVLEEWRTITVPYHVKQMLINNEDNQWPMNTSNCIHGHFKCLFSDAYNNGICSVSREVREQKLSRYFTIGEDWDPEKV